jgi:hypothetical protein
MASGFQEGQEEGKGKSGRLCECSQVISHKGHTDLADEMSPLYRESPQGETVNQRR